MSGVQAVALGRALALLKAAGVKFAVIDEDGIKHGELEIAEPKTRKVFGPRKRWDKEIMPGYREQISKMQPGDQIEWVLADHQQALAFQKVSSGCAHANFGSDNYITLVKGNEVELLRVV